MKVTLQEWAEANYRPAPSMWVLRKWVRAGEIVPAPEKAGKTYYVEETARRVTSSRPSLVSRLAA